MKKYLILAVLNSTASVLNTTASVHSYRNGRKKLSLFQGVCAVICMFLANRNIKDAAEETIDFDFDVEEITDNARQAFRESLRARGIVIGEEA